jgi:hypothetical protein
MASHGCYVYHPQSSAWEPLGFPRHSIMGVGTNYFPMKVDKLPQLQKLLSDEDLFFLFRPELDFFVQLKGLKKTTKG